MAFSSISHSNHQDMDMALENLGFSYLDDVPFCVDPRLAEANVDLSRAEALLARTAPSVSGLSSIDLTEFGRLEKQFLEHIAKLDEDAKAKLAKEEKEIAEYRERKQKEEDDRQREEAERKVKEEEKERLQREQQMLLQQEKEEKQLSEKLEKEAKLEKEQSSPKREFLTPKSSPDESAKMAAFLAKPPAIFNYSDFEAESDPFERAELQTLDDLRILATVLQTTSPAISGATTAPSFATASTAQTNTTQSGATMVIQPGMFFGGNQYYPNMNYQVPHYAMPYPNPTSVTNQMPPSNWPTQAIATNAQSISTTALKSSKSYGDILAEMKKEDSASSAASSLFGHQDIRKLSSQTPPPRPVPFRQPSSSVTNSALDWIPWPDLDGADTLKRRGSSPTKSSSPKFGDSAKILEGLSGTSATTCRMISDMGFPLSRVAKVCRTLGDDQQQIINYCLMADKFVEGEKFSVDAVEHVLLLHTVDENKSRKHLQGFRQLSEFGFESSKIHNALMSCDLDYEKTLESLL